MWLPIALLGHWLIHDDNLAGILTLIVLYVQFLWLVRRWGLLVHRQHHILRSFGLEFSGRNGLYVARGLAIGLVSVLLIFSLESWAGWIEWRSPTWGTLRIVLEGLIVSLAIGFAEELLFRGWMLDELQRDYSPDLSLWASAALFAGLHLRIWTFPALLCLGAALVWAKRSHVETHLGRRYALLGLPIGLHAGLVYGNYIVEVGQLIQYRDRVPAWITGIDHNPLAGLVGVFFMAAIALGMRHYAKIQPQSTSLKF